MVEFERCRRNAERDTPTRRRFLQSHRLAVDHRACVLQVQFAHGLEADARMTLERLRGAVGPQREFVVIGGQRVRGQRHTQEDETPPRQARAIHASACCAARGRGPERFVGLVMDRWTSVHPSRDKPVQTATRAGLQGGVQRAVADGPSRIVHACTGEVSGRLPRRRRCGRACACRSPRNGSPVAPRPGNRSCVVAVVAVVTRPVLACFLGAVLSDVLTGLATPCKSV